MQGGLDKAEFDLRLTYESTTDLVFGNWLLYSCLGGFLASNAAAGSSTLLVGGIANNAIPSVNDLAIGDVIVLTDGTNTELYTIANMVPATGGNYTITLGSVWTNGWLAPITTVTAAAAVGATSLTVGSTSGLSAATGRKNIVVAGESLQISSVSGTTINLVNPTQQAHNIGDNVSDGGVGNTSFTMASAAGIQVGTVLTLDVGSVPFTTTLTANCSAGSNVTVTVASTSGLSATSGLNGVVIGNEATTITSITSSTQFVVASLANSHTSGQTVSGSGSTQQKETLTVSSISGNVVSFGTALAYPHAANAQVVFQLPAVTQNAFAVGSAEVTRLQYQGYLAQRNHATPQGNLMSIQGIGFFSRYGSLMGNSDATSVDGATLFQEIAESFAGTLQPVIVRSANFASSSSAVNTSSTDTTVSEIMATIMRQENGGQLTSQYLAYVDKTRQIFHEPYSTIPVYTAHSYTTPAPTQHLTLADQSLYTTLSSAASSGSPTLQVTSAAALQHGMTIRIDAELGVIGTVSGSTVTLQNNLGSNHASGAGVLHPYGDTIGTGGVQTADMDGTAIVNAAIVTGTSTSSAGNASTQLTAATSVNQTVFPVLSVSGFEAGQSILVGAGGGSADTLTIAAGGVSASALTLTTTTGALHAHLVNGIVQLSSTDADTSPRILVEQADSISNFGWFEGTLSSEDITDEGALAAWAGAQLALLAWPALKSTISLDTTSCRITARDLLSITGFTDGSTLVGNVSSIQYTATAQSQNVSAQISLGVMTSTRASVMRQIAKERVIKHKYHVPGVPGQNYNMVVSGFGFTVTGPNTFTIAAGRVKYKGTIYDIPAYSGTAANGETRYGAQCVGTTAIAQLPNRLWNGRLVYANSTYQVSTQGGSVSQIAAFNGIPLYRIDCRRGSINGFFPLFSSRGTGLSNNPPGPASPTFSGSPTEAVTASANKISCDLLIQVTWNNIPLDDTTDKIKYYKRTSGGTAHGHLAHITKIPGLPQPSSVTFTDTINIQGIPNGQEVDIGASYESHNGESAINWFITAYTVGGVVMPSGLITAGPTISSCAVTRSAETGAIHKFSVAWTESDFGSNPTWLNHIIMRVRFNGDTDSGTSNSSHVIERRIDPNRLTYSGGSGSMTNLVHAAVGQTHDVGFAYVDMTGQESVTTWATIGNADPNGDFLDPTLQTVKYARHDAAITSTIRTTSPYDWTANAGYYALGNLGFTNENGEQFFADQSNYVPDIPLASGTIWHCEALIRKGSGAGTTSTTCGLGFWNADESSVLVDAYWIELPSSGYPQIVYYDSGGTRHVIYTSGTAVPSRTYYSFKMTITVGSTNTIEASIDNLILPIQTDSNLSITSWTDATGVVQTAGYDGTVSHDHMTHSVPHHTHQSLQTQNVIDTNSNIKNVPFATGVTYHADGTHRGFAASTGTATVESHPTATGNKIAVEHQLTLASNGDFHTIVGDTTTGYSIKWAASSGAVTINKHVSGTETAIATVATVAQDTNTHSMALTVTPGSPHTIEASFDGTISMVSDSAVTFGSTAPITHVDANAGTAKLSNHKVKATIAHHTAMSPQVQAIVSGASAAAATLNVNPPVVINNLPLANHNTAVQQGAVTGIYKNLIPDSGFRLTNAQGPTQFANAYWNTPTPVSYGQWSYGAAKYAGGSGGGSACFANIDTSSSHTYTTEIYSVNFELIKGYTYALSCYIDATNVTSGSPVFAIYYGATLLGYVAQTAGVASRLTTTFTFTGITGAGGACTAYCSTNGCTISASSIAVPPPGYVLWSEPMLQFGSIITAYQESFADAGTSNLLHGAMSTATQEVITSAGALASGTALANIGSGGITNTYIAAGAVEGSGGSGTNNVAALSIGTTELAASSVTTAKINSAAVTNALLAANSVQGGAGSGSNVIQAGSITGTEIAAATIGSAKLGSGVALANIGAAGVTSSYLAANAVTGGKVGFALDHTGANLASTFIVICDDTFTATSTASHTMTFSTGFTSASSFFVHIWDKTGLAYVTPTAVTSTSVTFAATNGHAYVVFAIGI